MGQIVPSEIEVGRVVDFDPNALPEISASDGPPNETLAALESGAIDQIIQAQQPRKSWPTRIRRLYRKEIIQRFYREQRFLFLLGLLVCMATLLVDIVVNPAMVREGAILRIFAVAPVTLLGLYAASKKWPKVLSFCIGAAPVIFSAAIVHLSVHLSAGPASRYLSATALTIGLANIVLPYSMRGLIAFNIAYIGVTYAALWYATGGPITGNLDYLIVLAIMTCSTLPLAYRFELLRQRNFLLSLRAQATSDELTIANLKLRELSERDPLTGMPNRRYFEKAFANDVAAIGNIGDAEAVLTRGRVAVMMIDLDHFKTFNDTHGHQAGDNCLQLVSRSLERIFEPANGVVARYGGEEFVAAIREREAGDAQRLAEEVRTAIETLQLPSGPSGQTSVTTSVGVALSAAAIALPREELIEMADAALYSAKRNGRNRVEIIEVEKPLRRSA
ncbi:MAG: GGDEF domain-containing protein [Erythrobacter sp.]